MTEEEIRASALLAVCNLDWHPSWKELYETADEFVAYIKGEK